MKGLFWLVYQYFFIIPFSKDEIICVHLSNYFFAFLSTVECSSFPLCFSIIVLQNFYISPPKGNCIILILFSSFFELKHISFKRLFQRETNCNLCEGFKVAKELFVNFIQLRTKSTPNLPKTVQYCYVLMSLDPALILNSSTGSPIHIFKRKKPSLSTLIGMDLFQFCCQSP